MATVPTLDAIALLEADPRNVEDLFEKPEAPTLHGAGLA